MKKLRILLVDDHPVVREGLKVSLRAVPHIQIVGEAANGMEAIEKTKKLLPNLLLMDISMPNMNGLETTKRILKLFPQLKIIILSMYQHKTYISEALQAGAKGYILKDCDPKELLHAIETVEHGELFLSSGVSKMVLNEVLESSKESIKPGPLLKITQREREVLTLIAKGLSNKEIARDLLISVRTIETHREHIMKKLDLHSVASLTRYAIDKGLILVRESD